MSLEALVLGCLSGLRPGTSLAALVVLLKTPAPRRPLVLFISAGFASSWTIGVLVVAAFHGVDVAVPGPSVTELRSPWCCCGRGVRRQRRRLEIGRKSAPPLYEREGRILKRKYFDSTERVLRQARQQGARHRALRAVRAHLHHGRRRRHPDERRRFFLWSAVGAVLWVAEHHPARVLPRPGVPRASGENIDRRSSSSGVHDAPAGLRVLEAPPARAPVRRGAEALVGHTRPVSPGQRPAGPW